MIEAFPHIEPVTRKMFQFDDVIMNDIAREEVLLPISQLIFLSTSKIRKIYRLVTYPNSNNKPVKITYLINHYNDVIMGAIASQITSLTIVFSTVYLDTDQRKHQSSASLAFVRGIHRRPVNSPHKWPVTRKMFPFDDVIMHDTDFANQVLFFGINFKYCFEYCSTLEESFKM